MADVEVLKYNLTPEQAKMLRKIVEEIGFEYYPPREIPDHRILVRDPIDPTVITNIMVGRVIGDHTLEIYECNNLPAAMAGVKEKVKQILIQCGITEVEKSGS